MKKLKLLLMLLMVGILSSGCIKFNVNMDIKKDKSMDFTIIYAIDKTYSNGENSLDVDEFKEAEKNGFKVEEYKEGNMEGFKLTKNIKNIDEVSTEKDAEYSLSGFMKDDEDQYLFKVEKGLFKNTYTAKFTFDANESGLTDDDTLGDEIDSNDDEILFDGDNDFDLTNMASNLDLSFNVTLPYKAISNNATKIDDNNKKLSSSLTTTGNDTIDFTFSLYNMTLIYICIGIFVLIVAVVIVVISKKKNKKDNNSLEENPEVIKKTIDSEE